uniref:SH2 domain containing 5 n=1 Tax=Naja naja TaxID=35670 RepID=A0A8C6YHB9_NAJNA
TAPPLPHPDALSPAGTAHGPRPQAPRLQHLPARRPPVRLPGPQPARRSRQPLLPPLREQPARRGSWATQRLGRGCLQVEGFTQALPGHLVVAGRARRKTSGGERRASVRHSAASSVPQVQALHYLLCRFFQLGYLLLHPEEQDWSSSGGSAQRDSGKLLGASLDNQVVWESLNPEEVSQNVNALVSFRRLPCPTEFGTSVSVRERLDLEESTGSSVGSARPGNPYCSPILVRKKAIRSKILRSGAYRGCTFEAGSQQGAWEGFSSSCDGKGSLLNLPENENDLRESVWAFAGINRDASLALLRNDMLGAFLLWAESGSTHQWCLAVRTRCGVVPYQIYRSQLGKYSVEHLNIEFPSMEALLDNYSGVRAGLFCSLGAGRINHCYEEQDGLAEDLWGEERTRRKSSWLFGAGRSLAVQHEGDGYSAGSFS